MPDYPAERIDDMEAIYRRAMGKVRAAPARNAAHFARQQSPPGAGGSACCPFEYLMSPHKDASPRRRVPIARAW
jgi:hypothetical protein